MATWKKIITAADDNTHKNSNVAYNTDGSGTLPVGYGGTGATALNDKAVLISQDSGTDTLGSVALTTSGQLIIGGASGPAAATITQGSNMTITNADGAITIAGTANDNTQNEYATSWVDSSDDALLRLTESGAGSGTQDIKIVAGTGITVTPSGSDLTIAAPHTTDTNTQNEYATSWVDSSSDALLRLTESGAGSGTQDIKMVAGTGISLTPSGSDLTITNTISDSGNTQNEYATSWVDSSNDALLRLTESGAGSGTQDLKIVAGTGMTVTPSGSDLTIATTITDTNTTTTADVQAALAALDSTDTTYIGDGGNDTTLNIRGNLTVTGLTTTVDTETIKLSDNKIVLNSNETGVPSEDAGLIIERGSKTDSQLFWDESGAYWSMISVGDYYSNSSVESAITSVVPSLTLGSSAPQTAPTKGAFFYDTDDDTLYVCTANEITYNP